MLASLRLRFWQLALDVCDTIDWSEGYWHALRRVAELTEPEPVRGNGGDRGV